MNGFFIRKTWPGSAKNGKTRLRAASRLKTNNARDAKTGAVLAFNRIKALTVYGYFTSKPVQQNILKTQMFFDGYHGNVPFTPAI